MREIATILLADDYATRRGIVRSLLGQLGCDAVDEASDGAEALKLLGEKSYDLLIAEAELHLLPAARLRHPRLPVLIVTTRSRPEEALADGDGPGTGYIVAPFDAETLRQKMQSVRFSAAREPA